MPGDLDRFLGRTTMARCPECSGVDLLSLGFITHKSGCSRNRWCEICSNEIEYGQRRWNSRTVTAHLDCINEYSEHLDEEHR